MYKIVTSGVFLATVLFFGNVASVQAADKSAASSATATTTALVSVETRVREYFTDIPVMAEIARCESKFRQFTDSGAVLRGGAGGGMIGVFQFYETIHSNAALGLGFDLATLEGNLGYARHLYELSGTGPWNSSTSCWKNSVTTTAQATDKEKELQIKLLKQVIVLLQQLLVLQLAAR